MSDPQADRQGLRDQKLDELIGLARGLTADGTVNEEEVRFLAKWLVAHREIVQGPVTDALIRRVDEILADGSADEDERASLFEALRALSGNDFELGEVFPSADIPFDAGCQIIFPGRIFCVTGAFVHGGRDVCESEIKSRGGAVHPFVTFKTNYLVVGAYATSAWKHSPFGKKILTALEYRDRHSGIAIIAESDWAAALDGSSA